MLVTFHFTPSGYHHKAAGCKDISAAHKEIACKDIRDEFRRPKSTGHVICHLWNVPLMAQSKFSRRFGGKQAFWWTWQQHGSMAPNKIISTDNFSPPFSIVRHWFVSELIEWLYGENWSEKKNRRCGVSQAAKSAHFHLPTGVRIAIESLKNGKKFVKFNLPWNEQKRRSDFNFLATPKRPL